MVPGDFMCKNGGHCVFKQELVGLFDTEDIDALLNPKVRIRKSEHSIMRCRTHVCFLGRGRHATYTFIISW